MELYKLNFKKIKSIEDVKNVLIGMDAQFNYDTLSKKAQKAIKPYLKKKSHFKL